MIRSTPSSALAICRCPALLAALAALLLSLQPLQAEAAKPFYLGRWKIESAVVAPWARDRAAPDDREMRSLLGKTVTLSPKFIAGPLGFPCQGPHYEIMSGEAEMLFQGMFGEMKSRDPKVDPLQLAHQVGLEGKTFRTVITGCEFEVDFSFGDDPDRAEFALNNYVYLLKRQ